MWCYLCEREAAIWELFNLQHIDFEHSKLPTSRPIKKLVCLECSGLNIEPIIMVEQGGTLMEPHPGGVKGLAGPSSTRLRGRIAPCLHQLK